MKQHKSNKNYKEELALLAHGRGKRKRLSTRVIPSKRKKLIEAARFKIDFIWI